MKDETSRRFKAWAVALILILALWSMLSGTAGISRNWSAAHNTFFGSRASQSGPEDDADALEMEMREKLVRHAWEGYRFNPRAREKLSGFWHDAFEAAFEDLESESPAVSDAAVLEIARLSTGAFSLDLNTGKPKTI